VTALIYVPEVVHPDALNILAACGEVLRGWEDDTPPVDAAIESADAILTRAYPLRAPLLAGARRLKVIGRAGVGFDHIDLDWCTDHGVPVIITPSANYRSVAEHVFALVFGLSRALPEAHALTKQGRFHEREVCVGRELHGRHVGILGAGRVGCEVARMASALDMPVGVYSNDVDPTRLPAGTSIFATLPGLLDWAHILTVHLPLTDVTHHLIDSDALRRLPPDAIVINTARGGIVDEVALAQALHRGELGGAAVDVYSQEPPSDNNPLLDAPNTLLTPHTAAFTHEALRRMGVDAARAIAAVLDGERPTEGVVNPEAWSHRRWLEPERP